MRYYEGPSPSETTGRERIATLTPDSWTAQMRNAQPVTRRVWSNAGDLTAWYWEDSTHALRAYRDHATLAREGDSRAILWLQQRKWKVPRPFPPEFLALSDSMRAMFRKKDHGSGHFGTEHEFFGVDSDSLSRKLLREFGPEWGVKYDGSVNNEGLEVATPVLYGKKGRDTLTNVLDTIEGMGGQLDASCGLHVHHSAAHLNAQKVWEAVLTYKFFQPAINSILPASRTDNEYCRSIDYAGTAYAAAPSKQTTMKELADQGWGRYYVVNLSAMRYHGTVEFRQHSATLNPVKTLNWVDLTRTILNVGSRIEQGIICEARKLSGSQDRYALDSLMEYIGASESVREYYKQRSKDLGNYQTGGDHEDVAANEHSADLYEFWCDSCGDGVRDSEGCPYCCHCEYCGCGCDPDEEPW